jgi:selenocysteine-specific elongation factor
VRIVDVPGHERFITNLLAGVGGIDAALLIVAADEGPMPQTDEHLAILDLLRIPRGLVVLTKTDLVDTEWRDLVVEETREKLQGTMLAEAPILPVSSVTREGLDALLATIDAMLDAIPPHSESGKPRLPIDRVFTVAGFGTVVTGTLTGGPLEIGQEVEIQPAGLRSRIRGLQSHRSKVDRAQPGSRTAVNLSGLAVEDLARGQVLTTPGWLVPTRLLDAQLRLVLDAPVALEQNDEVDVFIGAAEFPARITLLNAERLDPGQEEWVQLRFPEPAVAVKGDRFIIRRPSPSLTIGGGVVIDPHPRRHRRFRPEVVRTLETLASGTPEEIIVQALGREPVEVRQLLKRVTIPEADARAALAALIAADEVIAPRRSIPAANDYVIAAAGWNQVTGQTQAMLAAYHAKQPLRRGMAKEEVRSRFGLPARAFEEIVSHAASLGMLVYEGDTLRLPEHRITFTPEQQRAIDRYVAALRSSPYAPPLRLSSASSRRSRSRSPRPEPWSASTRG